MTIKINRKVAYPLITIIGLTTVACASNTSSNFDAFDNPQNYLGEKIRVCGRMVDSANLVQIDKKTSDKNLQGFVIVGNRPTSNRLPRGKLCVEGLVVFIGCQTGDVVCTDAAFDYGIEIQ